MYRLTVNIAYFSDTALCHLPIGNIIQEANYYYCYDFTNVAYNVLYKLRKSLSR